LTLAQAQGGPSVGKITDVASYEVYAAVLTRDARARQVSEVVLRGSTRFDKDCITSADAVPTEWNAALTDYFLNNREPSELDAHASMTVPFQLIGTL
jgi:hypothetical protein